MEDVIFYLIVAGAVIINVVRSYQKASKENQKRDISKPVSIHPRETPKTSSSKTSQRTNTVKTSPKQEPEKEIIPVNRKYQAATPSFSFNYEPLESLESLETIDVKNDRQSSKRRSYMTDEFISENRDNMMDNSSIDLQLDTQEDLKRAFVHTLVFERKY